MLKVILLLAACAAGLGANAHGAGPCGNGSAAARDGGPICTGSRPAGTSAGAPFSAATPPAGWTRAVASADGALTYYVNVATIRRTGDRVTMWDLLDSRTTIASGRARYRSMSVEREYDCDRGRVRILFISAHSGNLGEGELVGSEDAVRPWISNATQSVGRGLWDVACGQG